MHAGYFYLIGNEMASLKMPDVLGRAEITDPFTGLVYFETLNKILVQIFFLSLILTTKISLFKVSNF